MLCFSEENALCDHLAYSSNCTIVTWQYKRCIKPIKLYQDINASALEPNEVPPIFCQIPVLFYIDRLVDSLSIVDMFSKNKTSRTLLSQVGKLIKLYLVFPMSNATSERSVAALHRIKIYLRSTMTQTRLNHVMFLTIHKKFVNLFVY